jgi:spermidine synthase
VGETLARLKERLAPGGILISNLITDSEGPHQTVRRKVHRAFAAAFPSVRVVVPPLGMNEILVGGETTLTSAALRAHAERLEEGYDRRCLMEIRVSALRRRAAGAEGA